MSQKVFFLLLSVVALTRATKGNLHTHCAGEEYSTLARWNDTSKELIGLGDPTSTRLIILCITTLVTYEPDSIKSNPLCKADDPPPHRLFIKGEPQSGSSLKPYEWDIEHVVGGSVDHLVYSSPVQTKFSLHFRNEHPQMCDLRIFYIIEYIAVSESKVERQNPLPSLIEIEPQTAYLNKPITFTFKQEDRTYPTDRVRAVLDSSFCNDTAGTEIGQGDASNSKELHYDSITKSVWSHVFTEPGSYKLCYKHDALDFEEIAQLTVFGGNPEYFVAGNPNDVIYVGQPIPFRFYGTNLDLRPGHDSAKMVFMTFSCEDGPPSGGVVPTSDLGPTNEMNASVAVYDVEFKESGRYRVCYKRYGHKWVEVPSLDDLPDEISKPIVTPAPGQWDTPIQTYVSTGPPVPGTRSPYQTCPTAPPRDDTPDYQTMLRFQVNSNPKDITAFLQTFKATLAKQICLTPDEIKIDDVHRKNDNIVVSLYIECDASMYYYDSRERMNYIIYLSKSNSEAFQAMNDVTSLEEVERGFVAVDTNDPVRVVDDRTQAGLSGWHIVIIVALCVVLIVAVLIAGIVYMGRQGYATPMQALRNMWTSNNNDLFDEENTHDKELA